MWTWLLLYCRVVSIKSESVFVSQNNKNYNRFICRLCSASPDWGDVKTAVNRSGQVDLTRPRRLLAEGGRRRVMYDCCWIDHCLELLIKAFNCFCSIVFTRVVVEMIDTITYLLNSIFVPNDSLELSQPFILYRYNIIFVNNIITIV